MKQEIESQVDNVVENLSHYEIQKSRRAKFIEDWREHRYSVVPSGEVRPDYTTRGTSVGTYLGIEAGRPVRTVDAKVNELSPGTVSTFHRHSWDAVLFCVGGSGWSQIDDQQVEWEAGDSMYIPAWSWHRHGNNAGKTARFMSFSSEPLLNLLGFALIEDDTEQRKRVWIAPNPPPPIKGNDVYALRFRRLAAEARERSATRVHTPWAELEFLQTPRGTRSTFLVDKAIGYRTSGLTMAMLEIAPGRAQSMHRHSGEAWLYVVEGRGHSVMGPEISDGASYPWEKGDIICVDHYSWHQHFNDDAMNSARLVRVHILDTLLNTMNALCYPLNLLEEPPDEIRSAQAGNLADIEWPRVTRPSWP